MAVARRRGWGEGSIYQRADGRWEGQLRMSDGTRKHLYAESRRKAEQKMFALKKAVADGEVVRVRPQKVDAYLTDWLKATQGSVRPRTYQSYELNVRRVRRYFGRLRMTDVTPALV